MDSQMGAHLVVIGENARSEQNGWRIGERNDSPVAREQSVSQSRANPGLGYSFWGCY